jgi:hypothetical protein
MERPPSAGEKLAGQWAGLGVRQRAVLSIVGGVVLLVLGWALRLGYPSAYDAAFGGRSNLPMLVALVAGAAPVWGVLTLAMPMKELEVDTSAQFTSLLVAERQRRLWITRIIALVAGAAHAYAWQLFDVW